MATAPFGPVLEEAVKENAQGAVQQLASGIEIAPRCFCCLSGLGVGPLYPQGIYKDPVAVVSLSVRQVCTGDPVTADYSRSWAPSSTIATWAISWGDGQASGGAFPGAGTVAHPLGGYVLAGTYTVTLTVTDIIGATGEDTMEIDVVDCAGPLPPGPAPGPFKVFAACGASGVWYSEDGGLTWTDRSGAGFAGDRVFDLKVNPATIPQVSKEVWAATESGLFKTIDTGLSWVRIFLPNPEEYGPGSRILVPVASITVDTVDPNRVFVLGHDNIGAVDYVWLFRTQDGGTTWDYANVGVPGWVAMAAGVNGSADTIFVDDDSTPLVGCNTCFIATGCEAANRALQFTAGAWVAYGQGIDVAVEKYLRTPAGVLWACGQMDDTCAVRATGVIRQVAGVWQDVPGHGFAHADSFSQWAIDMWWDTTYNRLWVVGDSDTLWAHVEYYDAVGGWTTVVGGGIGAAGGGTIQTTAAVVTDALGNAYVGGVFEFANGGALTVNNIAKYDLATGWETLEGTQVGASGAVNALALDADGTWLYIGGAFLDFGGTTVNRFCAYNTITGEIRACGSGLNNSVTAIKILPDGLIYVGGAFTTDGDGDACGRVAMYDPVTNHWWPMSTGLNASARDIDHDEDTGIFYAAGSFTTADGNLVNRVAQFVPGESTVPTDGRAHLMDVDTSGRFVYIGLLDDSGFPVIMRITTDLEGLRVIYQPGAGTWGGVRRDPLASSNLWIFGDFGVVTQLFRGELWGDYLEDLSPGAWGVDLVRPVLPSVSAPFELIAILNVAEEVWWSPNYGFDWVKLDDTNFPANTAERDWLDDRYVFIGRSTAGADHLQMSVDTGIGFFERSTGITPNAPITAIQIVE